jgi:NADPH:quinone reductase-like Zn-dependent oxidoreductase
MKAVRIHSFGGPEVLSYEETPRPQVNPDDVLIKVHAAAINPVDWKIREGYLRGFIDYELPVTLGWDVSGVVEEVGGAVTDLRVGDEVYSRPDITRDGAYAEYIAVRASEAAPKPRSLDHVQAASVPLAALTAWAALFDTADLQPDQTVLIHAAAGGVGSFAVQLAKWKGARVIGTASAANHGLLRELGADELIDYTAARFEEVARGVDVVLDTIGGDTLERSWGVLRPGGVLVSVVAQPDEATAAQHGVRGASIFIQPDKSRLVKLAELIDAGHVRPEVSAVLPLAEARQAQELSQSGHVRGKIVLRVAEG